MPTRSKHAKHIKYGAPAAPAGGLLLSIQGVTPSKTRAPREGTFALFGALTQSTKGNSAVNSLAISRSQEKCALLGFSGRTAATNHIKGVA